MLFRSCGLSVLDEAAVGEWYGTTMFVSVGFVVGIVGGTNYIVCVSNQGHVLLGCVIVGSCCMSCGSSVGVVLLSGECVWLWCGMSFVCLQLGSCSQVCFGVPVPV
mgnify:CR=1 FL=1